MIDSLLALIAPYDCIACGVEGRLLCTDCMISVPKVPSQCFNCTLPTVDFRLCIHCETKFPLDSVWVRAEYNGPIKELLHQYKFGHKRGASRDVVRLLDGLLPAINSTTVVVSVPTAATRVRQRGFDHAGTYAKQFANIRKLIYLPCMRRSNQTRQVGVSKIQRMVNVRDTMSVSSRAIKGKDVLLVDDVMTTGASLNEAARALKAAGANKVHAAVIARVSL